MMSNDPSMTSLPRCVATAQAASTQVTTTTTVASAAQQSAGQTTLQTSMASPAMASSLLGLSVLNTPSVEAVTVYDTNDDNTAAIVGGAVGGSFGGLMLIGFGGYMLMK